jgi:hypothetical protein
MPPAVAVTGVVVVAALFALLPTCLYRYVEPRGRAQWGDVAGPRRAPPVVHAAAWTSFALGQLAVPWLLVPAACAALGYLQVKLGLVRPSGFAATVALGGLAVAEAWLAFRLIPVGIRLLMNDAKARARLAQRGQRRAVLSATILGGATTLGWSMNSLPGLVHPWLRAALVWTALRPVEIFAVLCLIQSLLLVAAARAQHARPEARKDERS